jgi:hypothetical protein
MENTDRARIALNAYMETLDPADNPTCSEALPGMIADLLHLSESMGLDAGLVLSMAEIHYEEEAHT